MRDVLGDCLAAGEPARPRSRRHTDFLALLGTLGSQAEQLDAAQVRALYQELQP